MKEQHKFLQIMKDNPKKLFVLATVIRVNGSAYRHEGAKMLFSETGEEYGLISGGCLEEDLSHRVFEVMTSKQSQIASYDLRSEDDLGWGQGAGCNGEVHVYLEALQWPNKQVKQPWSLVLDEVEKGNNIVAVRSIQGKESGRTYFLKEDGEQVRGNQTLEFSASIREALNTFMKQGKTFACVDVEAENSWFIFEIYEPKDTLYLFGAGRDVEPLVKRVAEFSFSTVIIDPRESRCTKEVFPQACLCVSDHPENFLERHRMKKNSYVLIMTHSFERDKIILQKLLPLENELAYLGVLGPTRRTSRLLDGNPIPDFVSSPIGLDIYADGAEEISISVIAELIQVRNKRALHNFGNLVVC